MVYSPCPRVLVFAKMLLAASALCCSVEAAPSLLVDGGNSSFAFDATAPIGGSNWSLNGVNHLQQLQYFVRIGATGPEVPISQLNLLSTSQPSSDKLVLKYNDNATAPRIVLDLSFDLAGHNAGAPTTGLGEQFTIANVSGAMLSEVSLFRYVDFNLGAVAADDIATNTGTVPVGGYLPLNNVVQTDGVRTAVSGATPSNFTLSASSRGELRTQVGQASVILGDLMDGDADNLSDAVGPSGSPNVAFAYQIRLTNMTASGVRSSLAGSFVTDVGVVPAPGSGIVFFGVGTAVVVRNLLSRRRS